MPTLYPYQRRAVKKMLRLDAQAGLFMEMGTGKSAVAIATARRLAQRILIVTPLSGRGVWRDEIKKWDGGKRRLVDCTRGSVQQRARRLKALSAFPAAARRVYVLVGYESYWREPLRAAIVRWYKPDLVIYDEAHRLLSRRTRQSKFAHSLSAPKNKIHTPVHRLALTGTPSPNGHHDLFSIYKAIDPRVFGSDYHDFEQRYLRMGGFMGYEIVGYKNEDELRARIARHSFRITKDEALDLPDQVDVRVPVEMSEQAWGYYRDLRDHAIVEVEGAQGKGTAISRIVLANIIRLQQVTSGFVKVEEDGQIIDFDTAKQDTLKDLLADALRAARRAVIFCRYTHDVDASLRVATSLVAQDRVYRLDGRIPQENRDRQIQAFKKSDPAVLVAQIQVAAETIDLTRAHVAVFYSPSYSLTKYQQARDRLHRHGQKHKVTYYHLVVPGTVDEKIYEALDKKRALMRELLDAQRARRFFS